MRIHAHTHINIACTIQSAVHIRGHLNQPYLLLLLWYRHYAFTLLKFFFFSFPLFQRLFLSLILCRCSTVFFSTSRICKSAHSFYFFFPSPFLYNLSILFLFISLTISYIMLFYLHRNSPLILSQHNNLAMSLLLCSPNIRVAFPHICFNVPRWLLISASFSFP